jgi:DNA repair exonuclease SbcCD ATPase subunit
MLNENASNLKQHLKTLHADLASTGEVDAELKDLLRQLDGDIKTLLDRRMAEDAGAEAEETTTYGLAERSQEITAKFAAKHPRLEPALRELGTILANMGI